MKDDPIQLDSKKWYAVAHGEKPLLEQCCDCGLVHRVSWKIENSRIFVNYARDDKETKKARAKITKAKNAAKKHSK
jgi:hypothetical protein